MDLSERKAKDTKLSEDGDVGVGRSLNDLPDKILARILSFLPMKEALKASVLSKRWEFLWTCMPSLHFDCPSWIKTPSPQLMNIADRAFVLRDSSPLETFSIHLRSRDDLAEARLNTWIKAAISHNVQKFSLDLCVQSAPLSVFTCQTLIELQIKVPLLKLPPSFSLSSLKVLSLNCVKFVDSILTEKLFSLPTLEVLTLYKCNWGDFQVLNISGPKLRKLSIYEFNSKSDVLNELRVLIDGVHLKSFEYAGLLFCEYHISSASSLNTAAIDIHNRCPTGREDQLCDRLYELLKEICNAKFLTLSSHTIEALSGKTELLNILPVFPNLTNLVFNGQSFNFDCQAPLAILTRFPCLETLVFDKGIKLTKRRKKYDWISDSIPPCFLSSLKKLAICKFDFADKEMIVLSILLEAAKVLEEVIIRFSDLFEKHPKKEETVVEAFEALTRGLEKRNFFFQSG